MSGYRWGAEGPPPEAYGRVTNAGRFARLHDVAINLLDQLTRDFDVHRTEGYGIDAELEHGCPLKLPPVRLAPSAETAAPIVVAFTAFPGLRVRFGRWCVQNFPQCGCDACDETAESEIERLTWLTANVIAGRFREASGPFRNGAPSHGWETWSDDGRTAAELGVASDRIPRSLAESSDTVHDWQPWDRIA